MKKGDKILLGFISSCLVVGLALVTAGVLFGGLTQAKEFTADNIKIIDKLSFVKTKTYNNVGTALSKGDAVSIDPSSLKNINIDVNSGSIEIATDNTNTIELSIEGTSNIHYYEENNTLYITGDNSLEDCDATVILPASLKLDNAFFDIGAAEININDISCNTLSLNVGAGEADLNNINVSSNALIKIGAGELDILDANIANADIDLSMGEFDYTGLIPGNLTLKCGMGEASLNLNDSKSDHTLNTECGMGSITVNDSSTVSFGNEVNASGNNDSIYNISCGMGSISIDFAD